MDDYQVVWGQSLDSMGQGASAQGLKLCSKRVGIVNLAKYLATDQQPVQVVTWHEGGMGSLRLSKPKLGPAP